MARKLKDLSNKKFSYLFVKEYYGKNNFGQSLWKCICDCGVEKIVNGTKLQNGDTKSCGCLRLTDNLVGQIFGNLKIIKREHTDDDDIHIFWKCLCICGSYKIIRGDSLKSGETSSCGCLHPRPAHTNIIQSIIASAKCIFGATYNDGNLTFEEFFELSQYNCFYCNIPPSNHYNGGKYKQSSQFYKTNGLFIYNGLDRVDNSLPHNKNNVVPCCYPCNWAKSNRRVEDFIKWVIMIANNVFNNSDKSEYIDILNKIDNLYIIPKHYRPNKISQENNINHQTIEERR